MSVTHIGTLRYGAEYPAGSGVLHYDFEMRVPTIADNIAALEEVGPTSSLQLNVAMMARCLVRLGDIPAEAINTALLNGLVDEDYDELADARDALKKKRKRPNDTSPTSDLPSSFSDGTASRNTESGS
ncbi:hypothetical protein QO239_23585 [Cupriavidus taiwanensis]|uniref:hypothetical protein n=1 Tax=Cupriavidus taiwanensis TaxID=164546 RepID=UPI002540B758|nr:hypothetical protein [Cupriavidus taiwanensis]MDK3025581.1 hypothetical protein [Cupriavidus taiwanensis]